MTYEWLGIAGGIVGVVGFFLSVSRQSKTDGAQLARIEANGISTNSTLQEIKGDIVKLKDEQSISRTFRDKYEEPLKEVIKHKEDQERINTHTERDIKDIKKEIQRLNDKFDRVMELFNKTINK